MSLCIVNPIRRCKDPLSDFTKGRLKVRVRDIKRHDKDCRVRAG